MTLKFTNSRDGNKRATITIKSRVGLTEFVNAVCYHLVTTEGLEDLDEIPRITKTFVERTTRDVLTRVGHESYGCWSDDLDSDIADELEGEVCDRILKLYPELR